MELPRGAFGNLAQFASLSLKSQPLFFRCATHQSVAADGHVEGFGENSGISPLNKIRRFRRQEAI
jgi:hypothetical protein